MELPPPNGTVTLLTDFGLRDPYVGIVKGVIKRHFPAADVVDVCHDVPPQDLRVAALFAGAAWRHFATGTVHVVVVDPGVGTSRRGIAACTSGGYWVAPDNGVLEPVLAAAGGEVEVREIDVRRLRLPPPSATFHGRDVFAPAAGLLAGRKLGFRALGARAGEPVRMAGFGGDVPEVLLADRFGNLVTGVSAAAVARAGAVAVAMAGRRLPIRRTYAEAAPGEALALINSYDLLEIAVNGGDAASRLGAGPGTAIELLTEPLE